MDDLVSEFAIEASESLAQLDSELVRLERDAAADPGRVSRVLRIIHTIKGTAGFLGLNRIEALAHAAEGAVDRMRHDGATPATISLVLEARDRIGHILADVAAAAAADRALIERLDASTAGADPRPTIREKSAEPADAAATTRIDTDQIGRLAGLADELAALVAETRGGNHPAALPDRLTQVAGALQQALAGLHRQAIGTIYAALPRFVRDLAHRLGKEIEIETSGADILLDRHTLARLKAPLLHLVRNAADHGIESAAERLARGKPAAGTITVSAGRRSGAVVVTVADDGNGLPLAAIGRRALEHGLASPATLAAMSDQQIADLIFISGFSTAATLSPISGRGVGMDAVRADIAAAGGTIEVASRAGLATRFTIVIPLDDSARAADPAAQAA